MQPKTGLFEFITLLVILFIFSTTGIAQTVQEWDYDSSIIDYDATQGIADDENNSFNSQVRPVSSRPLVTIKLEQGYRLDAKDEPNQVTNRLYLSFQNDLLMTENLLLRVESDVRVFHHSDHKSVERNQASYSDWLTKELYLQLNKNDFTFRLGRQRIIWGEAQSSAVSDVVSPRDNSEFVFIELEESRIGLDSATLEYFSGRFQFSSFLSTRPNADVPLANTSPFSSVSASTDSLIPPSDSRDTEYGIRMLRLGDRFDYSLMAAHLLSNFSVSTQTPSSTQLEYRPYDLIAFSASTTKDSWLLRTEFAHKMGFPITRLNADLRSEINKRNRSDIMIGMDYSTGSSGLLSAEVNYSKYINWDRSEINTFRENGNLLISYTHKLFRETLTTSAELNYLYKEESEYFKLSLDYSLKDNLSIKGDVTVFKTQNQTDFFQHIADQDRFTFRIAYTF